jgi:hypothetical protein
MSGVPSFLRGPDECPEYPEDAEYPFPIDEELDPPKVDLLTLYLISGLPSFFNGPP